MPKAHSGVSRRLVLRGAGGFTLGLPFLPSLVAPKGAYGAEPAAKIPPRFVAITTEHGGIFEANMYPGQSLLTQRMPLFPGHEVASGTLVAKAEGADAVLSPVLRAPASVLSDRLISKINILHGLDIPWGIQHHSGGHLGNYAANAGNGGDGIMMHSHPFPTIDQVMAWSPAFYSNLSGIRERAIITGGRGGVSFNYSNPAGRSGGIQEIRNEPDSLSIFNRIFQPGATKPEVAARKPIVDRVIENYRSLRQSNKRMGAADRQRLDDHMARLAELQRNLNVTVPVTCNSVKQPTDDTSKIGDSFGDLPNAKRRYQLYNDVIAAAFICGTSRIAVVGVVDPFSSFGGDWHQEVAHKGATTGQPVLVAALRQVFEGVFLDLMKKLDVEEGNGTTYLDNTLMAWSQESGVETHDSMTLPVVTAGSAAGFFKTGQYLDFRNKTARGRIIENNQPSAKNHGLTYNRWLATALQAMGVPRTEFERNGVPGYGHPYVDKYYASQYTNAVPSAGEVLPFMKA